MSKARFGIGDSQQNVTLLVRIQNLVQIQDKKEYSMKPGGKLGGGGTNITTIYGP